MALTGMFVVTSVVSTAILIFVNALLLMASTKIFKVEDSSYKSALWVTAILGLAGFIIGIVIGLLPVLAGVIGTILTWVVVGVLLAVYLIKIKYNLDFGKAALVWLVYFVFALIAYFIIAMVLGIIFLAVGLGMAAV